MTAPQLRTPFGEDDLEEIDLRSAPLARVIAQLRYPKLTSMQDQSVVNAFAREISDEYPIIEEGSEVNLVIDNGIISHQEQKNNPIWRLRSPDENWTVTVGMTSLALEVNDYKGRADLCQRVGRLAEIFIRNVKPPRFDRLGIRYINRIAGSDSLTNLEQLVRSELLGATTLTLPAGTSIHHSLSETQFDHEPGSSTLLRTAHLPPNSTIDPSLPPVGFPSWILDIDCSITGWRNIDLHGVQRDATTLAERAYRVFRYAVTGDFIEIFRGEQ
jgi:uncharacterized protein (TIGR04255 family)